MSYTGEKRQDRQFKANVTLWSVRVTIVVVAKQQ